MLFKFGVERERERERDTKVYTPPQNNKQAAWAT